MELIKLKLNEKKIIILTILVLITTVKGQTSILDGNQELTGETILASITDSTNIDSSTNVDNSLGAEETSNQETVLASIIDSTSIDSSTSVHENIFTGISSIGSSTINPAKLPSKPTIVNATFNFNNNKFSLKWQLSNNGGSLINQASLLFQIFNLNGILTNKTIESCYYFSNINL